MRAIPNQPFEGGVETVKLANRGEWKSAIVGMVLGDGCLSKKTKNSNVCLQMTHSVQQYEYLLWKKKIIEQVVKANVSLEHNSIGIDGKSRDYYHLGTRVHPYFTQLRKRFYHKGIKVVDEYIVKRITPLALAIWYMDDGCLGKAVPQYQTKETFYICCCGFDYANQMLLKKSLKILYDLDFNINKQSLKSKKGKRFYQLRLLNKHNEKFAKIIKPYVEQVPCMTYKLGSYANLSDIQDSDTVRPA